MKLDKITAKELQITLKVALKKIAYQEFNSRLGTVDCNREHIFTLISVFSYRNQCKNVKLRHIYFSLISKDFFTVEKMFRYKMVDYGKCKR
jgi:hypothetical protein